jgi:hypothetical protein
MTACYQCYEKHLLGVPYRGGSLLIHQPDEGSAALLCPAGRNVGQVRGCVPPCRYAGIAQLSRIIAHLSRMHHDPCMQQPLLCCPADGHRPQYQRHTTISELEPGRLLASQQRHSS